MVEIPEDNISMAELEAWYDMGKRLKNLKASEMLLRKKLFGIAFPDPCEGTNNYDLDDGYVLKGQYSLDRKVDEGAFGAIKDDLREAEVYPDKLVEWKPSLVKREYNKLSDDQRKLFDQCLIIKPSSPAMTIVQPAKNKAPTE